MVSINNIASYRKLYIILTVRGHPFDKPSTLIRSGVFMSNLTDFGDICC